ASFEQRLARCARHHLTKERRHLATLEHRLARSHPGVQLRERAQKLDELEARLKHGLERRIGQLKVRLARLATGVAHANPARRLAGARERWRTATADLRRALLRRVELTQQRWKLADRALQSLSPLATLQRGYAIVMQDGGKVLTDSRATARGAELDVRLARGGLTV